MTRSSTGPQALAQRARLIRRAFDGRGHEALADRLGCARHAVGVWRRRWAEAFPRLILVECCAKESALSGAIDALLSDLPRPGCPGKFTAEQLTRILAVAGEPPKGRGRPVTHGTPRGLADEAQKRGLVESTSARHVGRFVTYGRAEAAPPPLLADRRSRRPGAVPAAGRGGL